MEPKPTENQDKSQEQLYSEYINSPEWQAKRKEAIDRDQGRCVLCNSSEDLHVHHRTYDNFGNEPLEDLTTLCRECHDVVTDMLRRRRYEEKGWKEIPNSATPSIPGRIDTETPLEWTPIREISPSSLLVPIKPEEGSDNVVQKFDLPNSRPESYPAPQRTNGRSPEPLYERNQKDFWEKEQN